MWRQLWNKGRCHERGWATLVIPITLIVIGLDSGRAAWFSPQFWGVAGFVSAASVVWYRYHPSRKTLRSAVSIVAASGLLRGMAFLPDFKIAPFAAHALIATLAYAFYQAKAHDLPKTV